MTSTDIDGDQCAGVWIGIAHVHPLPGNDILEGAIGAYVPVVAIAEGKEDFLAKAAALMDMYDLRIVEAEEVEPLRDRRKSQEVDDDVLQLAGSLNAEEPAAHSSFEAYFED